MRKKDDEKLKNIKRAVLELILEEGFHGTSISKIARAAGVSPATVYVYYENKELMLKDIYLEYSEDIFEYICSNISSAASGKELISLLVRSYYSYINEHKDKFYFVEQFSGCPALARQCGAIKGISGIYVLFEDLKNKKIIKDVSNESLWAILFSPLKTISNYPYSSEREKEVLLEEMISLLQDALLI